MKEFLYAKKFHPFEDIECSIFKFVQFCQFLKVFVDSLLNDAGHASDLQTSPKPCTREKL